MSYVAFLGSLDLDDKPIFVCDDRARAIEIAEARLHQQILDAEMAEEYEVIVMNDEDDLRLLVVHSDNSDDPDGCAVDWIFIYEVEDV